MLCNSHLCSLGFLERDRRESALREKHDLPSLHVHRSVITLFARTPTPCRTLLNLLWLDWDKGSFE
jgi:hypothetical protein